MSRFAFALIAAITMAATAPAQVSIWQMDPNHSAAQFAVRHLGISTVWGAFGKLSGSANYDPGDMAKCSLDAIIDAKSVDTRVQMRDDDLRSPNFLDVEKYPTITFHSKQFKSPGPGKLLITGDLTIHGVSKEVVLDVDGPTGPIKDPSGKQRVGVAATTKINRRDFGVNGSPGIVGDEVTITINAELIQPPVK